MIYFDNSATTPIHPEVRDAMWPYLFEIYGNPSSKYYTQANKARDAVEESRDHVARLLGCQPEEVIFTSGATESNNMVLKGVADQYSSKGNHIVTTKTEHPSILETAKYLETKGYRVTYLDVDRFARADLDQLSRIVLDTPSKPILVSVIWGNNEVGSLNDLESIAKLCNEHQIFLHTDATQVLGKIQVDMTALGINFLSCSSHKLHGPKGIGATAIKKHRLGFKTKMTPLLHGGEQEGGYRSGTLSVHNIVGFGKAAEIAYRDLKESQLKMSQLEGYLMSRLSEAFASSIQFNSDVEAKIPGIVNVRFESVNNELLLKKLSDHVALSTGSACSSGKPSHVLSSMGINVDGIRSSVRISLSKLNTIEEIDQFLIELKK
ncbi:cysteine desulfurase family protein [Tumebacillus sp. DT12]|uniref:Cysteine desulfurase family protein n=1 Tax=Tumebacillus lacus TaxID=2995335 RepID=A0ABT3WWY3_9BACL|nr:cysteine desulfurase family protein [Tumebacillus lacus]MCX7569195.1 cysteine desulfurase family protein [Tumebacillus lacus]